MGNALLMTPNWTSKEKNQSLTSSSFFLPILSTIPPTYLSSSSPLNLFSDDLSCSHCTLPSLFPTPPTFPGDEDHQQAHISDTVHHTIYCSLMGQQKRGYWRWSWLCIVEYIWQVTMIFLHQKSITLWKTLWCQHLPCESLDSWTEPGKNSCRL